MISRLVRRDGLDPAEDAGADDAAANQRQRINVATALTLNARATRAFIALSGGLSLPESDR